MNVKSGWDGMGAVVALSENAPRGLLGTTMGGYSIFNLYVL